MELKRNGILWFCVGIMALCCLLSVSAPLRFNRERLRREGEVKERLMAIREAQQRYLSRHHRYSPTLDGLCREGLLQKEQTEIPHSGGKKFLLRTSDSPQGPGHRQPRMECSATFRDYLRGMDEGEIQKLMQQTSDEGRFPGLRIGDITKPNDNAGNWE